MTRALRKRHLIMWLLLAIVVASLMVYARMNIPEFPGDQVETPKL